MRHTRWMLLFALLLAGCGGPATTSTPTTSIPTPTTPATGQELHVLCTGVEDWCKAMLGAFEARTGIKATYERMSTGEAIDLLRAAPDNNGFDILHGGGVENYIAAQGDGLLAPYKSPAAEQIATQLKDPDGFWTGSYVGVLSFCSNTEVLEQLGVAAPQSWADLLDPKLKGQIAMPHPATSGTAYTALWTQVTLKEGDQDQALEYYKQLTENGLRFTKTGPGPGELASKGEAAVGVLFHHDCLRFIKQGATMLQASFPPEGTGFEIGGLAIVNSAPHPEAAQAYIDWALSTEAQEIPQTVNSFQLPINPEAAVPPESANLNAITLVNYNFQAAGSARNALVERFKAEVAPAPEE